MEPGTVSSPPFATRPPTQPTQMLTRTRTTFVSPLAGVVASGLVVSTLTSLLLPLFLPNHLEKSIHPYLLAAYPIRPTPRRKMRILPPFSTFMAIVLPNPLYGRISSCGRFSIGICGCQSLYTVLCASAPPIVF